MAKERIYPFAVASVRSMENKLLTKQKLLQMAEAKDAEEALRFLQDSDYGKTQIGDVHEFETMIQANLEEAYQAMGKLIPNEVFMDIFRFKNDYHNVKVLIKEEISKVNGRKFLIQGGSIPVEDLRKFFRERNYMEMPCIDEKAVEEAIELYAKTKNGRYIDTTLDRACFRVMSDAAEKLGIPYVATYVRKLADITNLKTLYRIYTLKRTEQELTEGLVPGGEISTEALLHAFKSDNATAALKETGYGRLCDSMELGYQILTSTGGVKHDYFMLDGSYDHFYFLTNDHQGEVILALLCDPVKTAELDRILSQGLYAGNPGRAMEQDAAEPDGTPVLFGYFCDLPRIVRFNTALELMERPGTLICFDFQADVLRRYCGGRVRLQTIDFTKFEGRLFP